jgi:hypothetical protein
MKVWIERAQEVRASRADALARPLAVALLSSGVGLTLGWIGLVAYWTLRFLI